MTAQNSTILRRQRPATIVLSPSVIIIAFFLIIKNCNATCYFSAEFRGSYKTQGTVTDNQIQYSQINITEDSIPIWGVCHKRIGNNVILMSSEQPICYRCFNLKLLSRNILRACTTDPDYISKCNANEEKALASCPSDGILQDSTRYTEIILYKQFDGDGQEIRKEYCPINGRYKIKYNNDGGQENIVECSTLDSELDNCPSSSSLNLRFKKCTFEDHEIAFVCLGHWEGNNKQMYLALMKAHSGKDKLGPQFRCAIYKENPQNGVISIVFSKDSTCSFTNKQTSENKVESPHSEVLTLYPNELNYWPQEHFCQLPEWMQGHWEDLFIKNDTIMFRDQTSLKSYTMKCLQNISNHILVYSRTQCDEGAYQCLRIKNRSPNILEFQISSKISLNYSHSICSNEYFDNTRWLTQGRLDHNYVYSPCPVIGKFKGTIPDDTNLCAKLVSECSSGDVMNYEIFECQFGEVYEERKYRCLGQWEEDGLIYTYTKRLDVGTYECFVGAERSTNRVYIKEAGEHCQRNVDPNRYGMELNKIENCLTIPQVIHPTQRNQKSETFALIPLSSTQKSITGTDESTSNTQKSSTTTHRTKTSGSDSIIHFHNNLLMTMLVALKISNIL